MTPAISSRPLPVTQYTGRDWLNAETVESCEGVRCRPAHSSADIRQRGAMRQCMGGGNTPSGVSPHPQGARLALRLVRQGDDCVREPARQARQREPRLQTLCKRLQRHNQRTGGGAAKGSRGGWYRRLCFLRHPHRTPWVPNGPAVEQNKTKHRILLPVLHRGKERRCSRHLLRKSKLQHLWIARVRATSSNSWTTCGLAGTRGVPLSCERLDVLA